MDAFNSGSGSNGDNNNNDDGKSSSKDAESLLMAAIPKKKRPPPPPPTSSTAAATGSGSLVASSSDALENMTIPRRSKPSKERSGGLSGDSSHSYIDKYGQRPSKIGSSGSYGNGHSSYDQQQQQQPVKVKRVSIISNSPFVLRIRLRGVSMDQGGIPHSTAPAALLSVNAPKKMSREEPQSFETESLISADTSRPRKRERISYEEVDEWDGLIDSDSEGENAGEESFGGKSSTKKRKLRRTSDNGHKASSTTASEYASAPPLHSDSTAMLDPGSHSIVELGADAADGTIDAPPPGCLGPLWYSRECVLHIFVVEKVVGWKRRPITTLEWDDPNALKFLDPNEAATLSQKALQHEEFWNDPLKRMEVSRINITQCPVIMALAAEREKAKAKDESRPPHFNVKTAAAGAPKTSATGIDTDEHEEVLLVKWRGRSYMHCSWERPSDIIKLDPSNSTARHKIRRFYQSQETVLGLDWRKRVEEDRATSMAIHSHGGVSGSEEQPSEIDEFFSPQCLEIERILGCDENELDMNVLAKQRALNIRAEQEEMRRKDETEESGEGQKPHSTINHLLLKDLVDVHERVVPWDPEDNVRYVVKWKGLPMAEITWEYWRDIKRDAVYETEDFWYRQKPPNPEVIEAMETWQHPHVKDFVKMQESPIYGISERPRPTARLGDGKDPPEEEENEGKQGFQLRKYQLEGVNWLLFNWWNRRSCILADEMGLGKTVQTLGFLQELSNNPLTKLRGPFLIVAPLSLIGQWQSEARGWAPDYNVVLYHGSADAREFLRQQEFYYTEQFVPKKMATKLRRQHVTKFHILITTYEVVMKEIHIFSKIKWKSLIVDEAHRLKNAQSRLFAELASVPRDHCVLLTGTPLANNTEELWALLHFDDPKAFADREDFLEKFGQMSDSKQVSELHGILKPYLLRRVKEDVEKSLPPKEEIILEVTLTPIQKKYYKAIYERNTAFLYKGAKPSNAPSLMNVMMELRKICNHPFLVKGVEDRILADGAANWKTTDDSGNIIPFDNFKLFGQQLVKSSGKMVLLEKLLVKLFAGGHKVLIFSQMVRVLDILEEFLRLKKYRYERLDGSTSSFSRVAAVDRFNRKAAQRFVMLLSTRAGGLGLNLTSADIVIIFDSDWNPQNDLQAMARAHRIGQTRKVQIFRLLTAKTYEMHMFHSASMKLGLERAVLSQQRDDGEGSGKSQKQAHAREIDELLKKGAYDVFKDDDDVEAEKFMETDIDQLLEQSSKKVTYGTSATESMGSGLGSFSKASFVTDTGDGEKDVDLDDPDFWAKAVGLDAPVDTPEEIAQMLDDGVKRSRKQVQQFNPYSDEQAKVDAQAQKEQEEREERERLIAEERYKKDKKKKKKEKRRREREELHKHLEGDNSLSVNSGKSDDDPTKIQVAKPTKKEKRSNRKRALRRAANEDPYIERLKQAWEVPQRNRATAACLRFGFGRFTKIRHESNLTSMTLQDLEVFVRSFSYQIALQVAVVFLGRLQDNGNQERQNIRDTVREWIGPSSEAEVDWLCTSIESIIRQHIEVQSFRRFLRMPLVLAEPSFVLNLRRGGAFRALRRLGVLSRLNRIIDFSLDSVLVVLGHEELAKRGCGTTDLSTLDLDLRTRHVTTEEMALAVGSYYRDAVELKPPAAWWDRSCDLALIIGSFVHGLGNYHAMQNDSDLPFAHNSREFAEADEGAFSANIAFQAAATASRKVFDDALNAVKAIAALEIQAAVAAAASEARKREKDALVMRQGGAAADVLSNKPAIPADKAEIQFTPGDNRFITLPRLQEAILEAVRGKEKPLLEAKEATPLTAESNGTVEVVPESSVSAMDDTLPMPDARILDCRLVELVNNIESSMDGRKRKYQIVEWASKNATIAITSRVRMNALSKVLPARRIRQFLSEYSGVGINGSECGISHKSLDDGANYCIGAATADLAQVAYGTDAPRYLRAIGCPMNLTRFAIASLVYSKASTLNQMLETEHLRFYINSSKEANFGEGTAAISKHKPTEEELQASNSGLDGEAQLVKEKAVSTAKAARAEFTLEGSNEISPDTAKSGHTANNIPLDVPSKPMTSKELVPEEFRDNTKVRAAICSAVLIYGYPSSSVGATSIHNSLWSKLQEESGSLNDKEPAALFTMDDFLKRVASFAEGDDLPPPQLISSYVEQVLLPFCLRLCVMGNGPSTRTARGSNGEFDTAFGISHSPEISNSVQTPLPDPCLELEEQSLEALGYALAVLRRVRLMESMCYIASGGVSMETLSEAARSSITCKNLDGLPLWWCPWVHDVAVLAHAATRGLFSVLEDRHQDGGIFSRLRTVQTLESTLPSDLTKRSSTEDLDEWTEIHAKDFPSLNVLERRLAFLCSRATSEVEGGLRFDNFPMFDSGGWPRL